MVRVQVPAERSNNSDDDDEVQASPPRSFHMADVRSILAARRSRIMSSRPRWRQAHPLPYNRCASPVFRAVHCSFRACESHCLGCSSRATQTHVTGASR